MYNLKDVILDRISTLVFAADKMGHSEIEAFTELNYILEKYKLITRTESHMLLLLYLDVLNGRQHYYLDIVRNIAPYTDPEI